MNAPSCQVYRLHIGMLENLFKVYHKSARGNPVSGNLMQFRQQGMVLVFIYKNWYEQMAELEKWMVGKTIDEIKAMKVKQRDASHPAVPDVPELTSLVTVTVHEYLEAVAEAYKNAK